MNARRLLKNVFGTVHLTRDEPGGGTGHMYVLPWEVKRYTPHGWILVDYQQWGRREESP